MVAKSLCKRSRFFAFVFMENGSRAPVLLAIRLIVSGALSVSCISSWVHKSFICVIIRHSLGFSLFNLWCLNVLVTVDNSIQVSLDSYLQFRRRWYDSQIDKPLAGVIVGDQELFRRVFMVFYRM